jgi:hypothetical protein
VFAVQTETPPAVAAPHVPDSEEDGAFAKTKTEYVHVYVF